MDFQYLFSLIDNQNLHNMCLLIRYFIIFHVQYNMLALNLLIEEISPKHKIAIISKKQGIPHIKNSTIS